MSANPYWIEGPWPGKLAIVPRPSGGDWLDRDLRSLKKSGIDDVASLLMKGEAAELELADEQAGCLRNGLQFHSLPIPDRGIPKSREELQKFTNELSGLLAEGRGVGVHCRQGIGRSGIIAASLLISSGVDPEEALRRISRARGLPVPETTEQAEWIREFARRMNSTKSELALKIK